MGGDAKTPRRRPPASPPAPAPGITAGAGPSARRRQHPRRDPPPPPDAPVLPSSRRSRLQEVALPRLRSPIPPPVSSPPPGATTPRRIPTTRRKGSRLPFHPAPSRRHPAGEILLSGPRRRRRRQVLGAVGCRHGLVLFFNDIRLEFAVWDPVTGERRCVTVPPEFDHEEMVVSNGAVLCAAGDQRHVHGGECHRFPFQVVLIAYHCPEREWLAWVYSSETGEWGDLSSAAIPDVGFTWTPGILSGDSLYWFSDDIEHGILKFDLGSQSLSVIEIPPGLDTEYNYNFCVLRTDNGGVGFAFLTHSRLFIWERKVSCDGAARWVLQKTVKLKDITGLSKMERADARIHGYDEDGAVIFILTSSVFFMVQLDSMQFRNLGQISFIYGNVCHPYRNFL